MWLVEILWDDQSATTEEAQAVVNTLGGGLRRWRGGWLLLGASSRRTRSRLAARWVLGSKHSSEWPYCSIDSRAALTSHIAN